MELEEESSAISGVSVSMAASGSLQKQLKIENTMETDKMSAEVVGLVGFPVEITSTTPFEEAVIAFQYDRTKLGDTKEEDLSILWYDEANMQYVLLEDAVVDTASQTVTYATNHFSTYLLVDKQIWMDVWRKDLNYDHGRTPVDKGTTYDIFLCLDYSVSEEELELEKAFARRLMEQMIKGDRVKIGIYLPNTWNTYYQVNWKTSKQDALSSLSSMETDLERQYHIALKPKGNYYSDNYQAIHMITDMVDKTSQNQKVGFLINAGKNEDVPRYITIGDKNQAETDLKTLGFPVHSVSVSNTNDVNKELEALLKVYGGNSFLLTNSDDIKFRYHGMGENLDMLDSDGDGLYDTYEVNGLRIQNGTVIYTDPYKADTDGDGISDFDEVGGMPQLLILSSNQYASTINYQKSDPNDPASTGKGAPEGYLLVNDFNYLPYSEKDYSKIFLNDTMEKDAEGNKIYGRYNIYNSNPNELTPEEVDRIRSVVILECKLAGEDFGSFPASFLRQYIDGEEDRYFYSCKGVLKRNKNAREQFANDALGLMQAARKYMEQTGETVVTLAQAPKNQNSGVKLEPFVKDPFEFHPGDFLAINVANTRTIGIVFFDGEKYTLDLKYYIFDYYDWDKNQTAHLGAVSDSQMYQMCRCGAARFYESWGLYETQFSWEPSVESEQEALKKEKSKLTRW